jgi:hypothetical protein
MSTIEIRHFDQWVGNANNNRDEVGDKWVRKHPQHIH